MSLQDCETDAAKVLWYALYKAQRKEDLVRRKQRLDSMAKFREVPAPKWQPDKGLRVVINTGRTNVPDEFYPAAAKALAGEIEIGRMTISGAPPSDPPSAPPGGAPKKEKKTAKRKDKKDAEKRRAEGADSEDDRG